MNLLRIYRNKRNKVDVAVATLTKHCIVWSLLSLQLSSCVVYRAAPIDPAQISKAYVVRSLDDPELLKSLATTLAAEDYQSIREGVWQQSALFVTALRFNASLAEARAHLLEVTSAVTTAKALPNLTVGLSTEYNLSQTAESPWLWAVSTDFLLDAVLRRTLRVQLSKSAVRAARLDYAEAIWTVRRQVHAALLAEIFAAKRLTLLSEAVVQRQQLVRLMQHRVDSGEGSGNEHLQLVIELTRSQSAVSNAERDRSEARANLAAAMGVPISALDDRTLQWNDLDRPALPDGKQLQMLREQALLSRPDLEHAIVDYQTRELELQQQVRAQYPQVSISPGFTWDHGIRKATLGLSLSAPLFSRNRGPIAEAQARRSVAGEHLLGVQAKIINEIDAAISASQAAMAALDTAHGQSESAQVLVEKTERAVRLGAEDTPTLLAARLAANVDTLAELDAVIRAQQALGQLEDALRTPLAGSEITLRPMRDAP